MTHPRAGAYARVIRTLKELGPAKLLAAEQARIRDIADTLLFCTDVLDDALAKSAVSELHALRDHLVESGRWTPERAGELADDMWACGPGLPLAACQSPHDPRAANRLVSFRLLPA